MESHLLKMIANKDFIAGVKEELIEYNPEINKIITYIVIVEMAVNDLRKITKVWQDKKLSDEK